MPCAAIPPYGTERSYNALRLAGAKRHADGLRVFLMGDADACAKHGQRVPQGFYNIERMLPRRDAAGRSRGGMRKLRDARGITTGELTEGARRSTLEELADWTEWADKVLVF